MFLSQALREEASPRPPGTRLGLLGPSWPPRVRLAWACGTETRPGTGSPALPQPVPANTTCPCCQVHSRQHLLATQGPSPGNHVAQSHLQCSQGPQPHSQAQTAGTKGCPSCLIQSTPGPTAGQGWVGEGGRVGQRAQENCSKQTCACRGPTHIQSGLSQMLL